MATTQILAILDISFRANYWLKEMISVLLAALTGFCVTVITFIADRFGHKVGGFIATAPVTAVIGVIFVIKVQDPRFVQDIILAGNYSVTAALFAVPGYFYTIKFLKGYSNTFKVIMGEIVFFVIYIGLVLALRVLLSVGWYLFVINIILVMILYRTFMSAVINIDRLKDRSGRNLTEFMIRFLAGAAAFFIIKFASSLETVISGAIAVFPGVFATSIGIMGFKRSAEFSARAIQSGIFGVASIGMFVFGFSICIPLLKTGQNSSLFIATTTSLIFYFSSLYMFGKIKNE